MVMTIDVKRVVVRRLSCLGAQNVDEIATRGLPKSQTLATDSSERHHGD
jgi:hypothetical protein